MKSYFYLQTKFSSLTVLQTNESLIEQFIIVQTLKLSMSNVMKDGPEYFNDLPLLKNSF